MTHKRYEKYVDTQEAWLGSHPSHWGRKPLWTLFRRVKRQGFESEELLSVYRDHGVIPKSSREDNFNKPSDDLGAYQLVEPGDLAVNKMKAWQGSVAISEHRGIVSPAYHVYTPLHSENQRFLHYLMRCDRYITGYLSISKGIRVNQWDLQPEYHSRMPVLLPPLEEQIVIASFLDRETAKIDALIAEQQRLIELLQEKRQAVISHAVTKGLNTDAPMKYSGVEWLGEVPAHWEVGPVKRFLSSMNYKRIPLSAEERATRQGEYPYYGASGIIDSVDEYLFEESLVLVSEDGANLLMRSTPIAFVASGKYWVNNHAHILKPNDEMPTFWSERIESLQIAPFVTGSAQPKLTAEALMNLTVAAPPNKDEKNAIEQRIQGAKAAFDPLLGASRNAIALLKERRSALISAAVTGQIDVRGLVEAEAGEQ